MTIDVFSDIVCPWCYVGEARLRQALADRPDLRVDLRWRPFQLQPGMPAAGMPWAEMVERKFGGAVRAQPMFEHLQRVGAADGVAFRFDRIASAPNTVDAHRLVLWAEGPGRAWPMANALFRAYFEGGADLNREADLLQAVEHAGLDAEAARAMLHTDEHRAEVEASQREAEEVGVTGVPFYVVADRYGISGAQPPEVFLEAFRLVEAEAAGA